MAADIEELEALYHELEPMLAARGIDTTPPDQEQVAARIVKVGVEVAPLRLHPHLIWFWCRWPPEAGECTQPGFTDPGFGLDLRDDLGLPSVYAVGYGHNQYLFAELGSGDGPLPKADSELSGPRIYSYDTFGDSGLQLICTGFADLLRYLIVGFESGEPIDFVAQTKRLISWLPPGVSQQERQPIDPADANDWPDHWQAAAGITESTFRLKGATHTVAELEAARRSGVSIEATLAGTTKNFGASSKGTVVQLTDSSGTIEVLIPETIQPLGTSPTSSYEIDVVAKPLTRVETRLDDLREHHHDVQRLAQTGDIEAAARAAVPLGEYMNGPHAVVAKARRPVR